MIILQSHDQFDLIGQLVPSTFVIEKLSKSALTNAQSFPIQGSFSEVQGQIAYLYREQGVLFFGFNDQVYKITDDTIAEIKRLNKEKYSFRLVRGNEILISIDYNRSSTFPPIGLDVTPFVEKEDYDFYLFVSNVLGDQSRRKRIYR